MILRALNLDQDLGSKDAEKKDIFENSYERLVNQAFKHSQQNCKMNEQLNLKEDKPSDSF